jgi:hypothetical protein
LTNQSFRVVPVVVDDRRWGALVFEVELFSTVFGRPVSAEDLVRDRVVRPVSRTLFGGAR